MPGMWLSCCSLVPELCPAFLTAWPVAHQALLSTGFPRQEYWSGLPFPTLGVLPDPGIEPASHVLAGRFFTTEPPGKPIGIHKWVINSSQVYQELSTGVLPKFDPRVKNT